MRTTIVAPIASLMLLACFSTGALAKKTTVTVVNNSEYTLTAVYKAVGCAQVYKTDHNTELEVCHTASVAPGGKVSYEFGGGTSGRRVYAGIDGNMTMLDTDDDDAVNEWKKNYVGKTAVIEPGPTGNCWDLTDDQKNSCAVSGFGIKDDHTVTWSTVNVSVCHTNAFGADCDYFCAQCGSTVSKSTPEIPEVFEGTVRCKGVDAYGEKFNSGPLDVAVVTSEGLLAIDRWGRSEHVKYTVAGLWGGDPKTRLLPITSACRSGDEARCADGYSETGLLKLTIEARGKGTIEGETKAFFPGPTGAGMALDCSWKLHAE
jgi:hypothetical protein